MRRLHARRVCQPGHHGHHEYARCCHYHHVTRRRACYWCMCSAGGPWSRRLYSRVCCCWPSARRRPQRPLGQSGRDSQQSRTSPTAPVRRSVSSLQRVMAGTHTHTHTHFGECADHECNCCLRKHSPKTRVLSVCFCFFVFEAIWGTKAARAACVLLFRCVANIDSSGRCSMRARVLCDPPASALAPVPSRV